MKEVVGVRFRGNGKVYYFDPGEYHTPVNTKVIVQTEQGMTIGEIVQGRKSIPEEQIKGALSPVVRIANEKDLAKVEENKSKEAEATEVCKTLVEELKLEMKVLRAEYAFDNSKVVIYFTADNRVDFRELVRKLASSLHMRIELRQIGVRDEAKLKGGLGICGRELCCHAFLNEFKPTSIRMAKEQGLSLSPSKLSGVCGKLMCCLRNEEEAYEYLNSKLPREGDTVLDQEGQLGIVSFVNVLRQKVRYVIVNENDEREIREALADDLSVQGHKKKGQDPFAALEHGTKKQAENAGKAAAKKDQNHDKNDRGNAGKSAAGNRDNKNAQGNTGEQAKKKPNQRPEKSHNENRDGRGDRQNGERPNGDRQNGRGQKPNGKNGQGHGPKPNQANGQKNNPGNNQTNNQSNNQSNNQASNQNHGQGQNGEQKSGNNRHRRNHRHKPHKPQESQGE